MANTTTELDERTATSSFTRKPRMVPTARSERRLSERRSSS
jgi:hypothetical protein